MIRKILDYFDDSDLSANASQVYIHLFYTANERSLCTQAVRKTAASCDITLAGVLRASQELANAGLIDVRRRPVETGSPDRIREIRVHDVRSL